MSLTFACQSGGGDVETIVAYMSPVSAEYGDLLTIEGSGLGEGRDGDTSILFTRPGESQPKPYRPLASMVETWRDDKMQLRIPFPLTGTVLLENSGGFAEAGTFSPASWVPAPGTPPADWDVLDAIALDEVRVAALLEQRGDSPADRTTFLFVFGPEAAISHPLDVGVGDHVTRARLASKEGNPEGVLVTSNDSTGAAGNLIHLTWSGGPVLSMREIDDDRVALGGDELGLFAWVDDGDGYRRLRPPTWSNDLGPVVLPDGVAADNVAAGGNWLFVTDIEPHGDTAGGEILRIYGSDSGSAAVEIYSVFGNAGVEASGFLVSSDGASIAFDLCYYTHVDFDFDPSEHCYKAVHADQDTWGYVEPGLQIARDRLGGFLVSSRDSSSRDIVTWTAEEGTLSDPASMNLFAVSRYRLLSTPGGLVRALVMPESLHSDDRRYYAPIPRSSWP